MSRTKYLLASALSVAMLAVVHCAGNSPSARAAEQGKFDVSQIKEYIEQLASRNKEPPFFASGGVDLPKFPAEYDWTEERRVRNVYNLLEGNISERVWKELGLHLEDRRFAIVVAVDDTRGRLTLSKVYDVGGLCLHLVKLHLVAAGRRHFHFKNGKGQPLMEFDFSDLLSDRRPLYETQIEVCERMLAKARELKDVNEEQRAETIDGLQKEIRSLRESKIPVFSKLRAAYQMFPPGFDYRTMLPATSKE